MAVVAIGNIECDRCGLWFRGRATPATSRPRRCGDCRHTRRPSMLDSQLARDLAAHIAAVQEARWALRVGRGGHALAVLEAVSP